MSHLYNNLCIFIFCSDLTLIVWREEQERHQNAVQQELEVNSLGKEKVGWMSFRYSYVTQG